MEGLVRGQLDSSYSPSLFSVPSCARMGLSAHVTWTVWRLYTFTTWNRKL